MLASLLRDTLGVNRVQLFPARSGRIEGMSNNPYEPPKTPVESVRKARLPLGGYAVALAVVVAVVAIWCFVDWAAVEFARWHSQSSVQSAPKNTPDSP